MSTSPHATTPDRPLRSGRWLAADGVAGVLHRATLRSEGFGPESLRGRPLIGICNSWSELVHCNLHLRALANAVRRGVAQAGGVALEFPTISLGENLMKPTTMLYRNLMAMDVEESIRAYPLDAVVLLSGCDKTLPAQLMGAASAGVPAIVLTSGPGEPARLEGRELGTGTDLWRVIDDVRAGRRDRQALDAVEGALFPTAGHCSEMGTASTMAILTEVLGLCLPMSATAAAVGGARRALAEATGTAAVGLARRGPSPAEVLTRPAFENAIIALAAIGGSTNAIVHLLALARRVGVELTLEDVDRLARRTPVIADVRPSGEQLVRDFDAAGGVPALLAELSELLHRNLLTVAGRRPHTPRARPRPGDRSALGTLDAPLHGPGGLAVLRGNLAPDGALIKASAASPKLLRHRGPAIVFDDIHDAARRIDDPALAVTEDSVLVLRNSGPRGGPGFPEWGMLPIPSKLLRRGVSDVVRVSDARMSGTAYGTVVLHVAPESAVGGPLAAVHDGDPVVLDVEARRLDLDIPPAELRRRRAQWRPPPSPYTRGYGALYLAHVTQAPDGCDFDFLQRASEADGSVPPGFVEGWIGGW